MVPVFLISGGSRTSINNTSGRFGKFSISSVETTSIFIFFFIFFFLFLSLVYETDCHSTLRHSQLYEIIFKQYRFVVSLFFFIQQTNVDTHTFIYKSFENEARIILFTFAIACVWNHLSRLNVFLFLSLFLFLFHCQTTDSAHNKIQMEKRLKKNCLNGERRIHLCGNCLKNRIFGNCFSVIVLP